MVNLQKLKFLTTLYGMAIKESVNCVSKKNLMKKYILGIVASMILVIMACTPTLPLKEEATLLPLEYKMNEVLGFYPELRKKQPTYEEAQSWLDVGFRHKYTIAKKYVAIKLLEQSAKVPIFIAGPHKDELNFNSTTHGHYNPAFLKKAAVSLTKALKDPKFKQLAQKQYTTYFQGMARNYYLAYLKVNGKSNEWIGKGLTKAERAEIIDTYTSKMKSDDVGMAGNYIQETFRGYADKVSEHDLDWYEAYTAPGFWIRRSIDGTDRQFFAMLTQVIDTFDAAWKVGTR